MDNPDPYLNGRSLRPADASPASLDDNVVSSEDFHAQFGEDIRETLDLRTWCVGSDLSHECARIANEVREAVERETDFQRLIRKEVFPRLKKLPIKNAGVHQADQAVIQQIHRDLLFRGGVEACDGTLQMHATLPLTIYQIGVSLVSYQGNEGTWCQRLFRRDLRQNCPSTADEIMASLERRGQFSAELDGPGELVQKALLDYAERAILLRNSQAPWRLGHGNPVTYELLTGGGNAELMVAATRVLRELVEQHQKFIFVAREPRDLGLLTIANALHPMEYAIIGKLSDRLEHWLHQLRFKVGVENLAWDDDRIPATEWIPRFRDTVASQIVVGLYRATRVSPAQVFYAHHNHADYAAHLVLADSVLQEQRGRPLLIDMARHVCDVVFSENLEGLAQSAYAQAGAAWRYAARNGDH